MKKIHNVVLLIAIILLSGVRIDAQIVDVDNQDSNWINYAQITSKSKRVYDKDLYQGDVYLNDYWQMAEFTLPDESKIIVDSVKLNLLRGHVEIFLNGKHLELRGSQFNSFQFQDYSGTSATYKSKHYYFDDGTRLPGIVKTIDVGDVSVLVAYKPGVRKVSDDNPLMLDRLKKDIVRITKLRYIEKEGELTRIKNKKDLQRYFGSSKAIKNYISNQDINHKEEGDIAKLITYVNREGAN